MEKKHKVTFFVNKEDWNKFQSWCAIQNESASYFLAEYVSKTANNELPANYLNEVQTKVNTILDKGIDDSLIDAVAAKVVELLEQKAATVNTVDTVAEIEETKPIETTTADTVDTVVEIEETKPIEAITADTADTVNKNTKQERRKANLAKFRHYKAVDNRKGYNDSYVANEENLSKQAVNRYRKGDRSPKADFIERWGLNWSGDTWVKNIDDN